MRIAVRPATRLATRLAVAVAVTLTLLVGGADPARSEDTRDVGGDTVVPITLSSESYATAGQVVRGGVPFPRELGITDATRLGVWHTTGADGRAGAWLPAQWQVLSRHGGTSDDATKTIRWALLQFPAVYGGTLTVRSRAPASQSPSDLPPDVAGDSGERIDVDTGRLRFSVARNRFAPLTGLRTVGHDASGRETERAAVTGDGLDVRMVLVDRDANGRLVDREHRLSGTAVTEVVLEENGPVRAAIRIRGRFLDDAGRPLCDGFLGYTIRLWADRGSDAVRVFFTLENDGPYGPSAEPSRTTVPPVWVRLRQLELVVPTAITAGTVRGATSDGAWDVTCGGPGADLRLVQTHEVRNRRNEQANFRYAVTAGGPEVARGARSQGGLQVDDGTTAVAAAVRHFWQSYPQAVSFDDGRLQVELWPREPGQKWPPELAATFGDAYEFEGGRHKTYEVLLAFGRSGVAPPVGARERTLEFPPRLSVAPEWVRQSQSAGGAFALPDAGVRNASLGEARSHFARMQKAIVDVRFADAQNPNGEIPPCSMTEQRETRGHGLLEIAPYDVDLYGAMSFGDLPHDRGFCSGHHDWVKGLFLNWLRHGKREFLDRGEEMLRHRYDIDQVHCLERSDPNWKWYNGFQRNEIGYHGARLGAFHPHGESPGTPQATWLEGLLVAYAVTGDPRAMECARENADAFTNYFEVSGVLGGGAFRGALDDLAQLNAMSNGVQQLLAFYEFTGERRYYDTAAAVFERGLLHAEEHYGNQGFFDLERRGLAVWEVVRLVHPLIEMHRLSGDPRALSMLLRVLRFFTERAYDGGRVGEDGRYLPLQLPYRWETVGDRRVARTWFIPYNFFTADGFAYAYAQTGEPLYLRWARRVWRDGVIFFQAPVHQPVPLDFTSAASYAPRQYPNSETKNDAWVLGLSQVYLALEDRLGALDGGAPIELDEDAWFRKRAECLRAKRPWTPPEAPPGTTPRTAPTPVDGR